MQQKNRSFFLISIVFLQHLHLLIFNIFVTFYRLTNFSQYNLISYFIEKQMQMTHKTFEIILRISYILLFEQLLIAGDKILTSTCRS